MCFLTCFSSTFHSYDHPVDSMSERVKPIEEDKLVMEPLSNGCHDAAERSSSTDNSSSQSTAVDETSGLCQGLEAPPNEPAPIQAVKKAKVIPKYSYVSLIVRS